MGMSTTVIGFAPPDEQWQKMKAIWDSCKRAAIEPPKQVSEFFDYGTPDPNGVCVELKTREWRNEYAEGFELDVSQIPAHVKVIRFYNSW